MLFDELEFGSFDRAERKARNAYEFYEDGKISMALLELEEAIDINPNITSSSNRVETFALASNEEKSFPAFILGIDPEKEDAKSNLSKYIEAGDYLESGSNDLLIGNILAHNLNIEVGDSIILFGQGYHGVSAVNIYKVAGLPDFPLPDLSKQLFA